VTRPTAEEIVRVRLAEAGLPAREDEILSLIEGYPAHKAMIDMLYAVEAASYESPALHFNLTPIFADWG
jgi:hypothetical protein